MATPPLKETGINEEKVLGKNVSQVNWKEGIRQFAIRMDNFTLIPWVLPHWLGEKHLRKKEIKGLTGSQDFVSRALMAFSHNIKGHEISHEATGTELLEYVGLKSSKITDSLLHDPKNSELRTQ